MSSTGTRKRRDVQTRAAESIIENDKEIINKFKLFAESSNATAGLAGPAVNNSPKTPAGNYLAREGDSMIGPLALGPPIDFTIEVDANDTIDVGPLNENVQYSSNIQLDDLQPNSAVLSIIANAAYDGQILVLRTFAPTVAYTISQGTLGNSGNIQTGDSNDLTVGDLQTVMLIFDESLIINANTGGTWRVMSVSASTGGGFSFPILYPKESLSPAASSSQSIDISQVDGQAKEIQFPAGDISLQIIGDPVATVAEEFHVMFIQDGVGGRSLTSVDSAIKNGANMDLLLDKAANARTMFKLITMDGGTSYHAILIDTTTVTAGYTTIQDEGVALAQRPSMNFVGINVTATDNPGLNRTDITLSTGSGALSTLTIDVTKSWLNFGIFDLQYLESNATFTAGSGFLRMGTGEEIRMRNPTNTDELVITSGNDALLNEALIFQVAGGNQLTVSAFDLDVGDNDILNTGDIIPGAGAHTVGDSIDFYNQMHSQFFIPQPATIITNRYGLAKTGNTLYVNYDDTNADAGFGIYEEGLQQFLFSNPVSNTIELFIGPDPFNAGETYRIQLGENSNSSAKIELTEGANDLFIDRMGLFTTQSVALSTGSQTRFKVNVNEAQFFVPANLDSEDVLNARNIFADTSNLATIGQFQPSNGGFDYIMRERLSWDTDPATYIGMDSDGIDIISSDGMLISATGPGDSFIISSVPQINVFVSSATGLTFTVNGGFPVVTIQDNGLVMQEQIFMGSNKIVNLLDPTDPQDAATKFYVDNNTGGGGGSASGNVFAAIVKSTDETVNNSTTLQNDDELTMEANPNQEYFIEYNLRFTSDAAADLKVGINIPAGATYRIAFGDTTGLWSASTGVGGGQTLTFSGFGTGSPTVANFFVVVYTGTFGGTVGLMWAQNIANGSDTKVEAGSLMRAYEQGSGGASHVTQDILLGTPDPAESWVEDTGRQWIGNDNGEQNLNIVLGTTEPAGFTDSYTIDVNDFPNGATGWEFNSFGALGTWTIENLGASVGFEAKLFINGREFANQGFGISTFAAASGWTTVEDVQVGDTIQIKAWSTGGSVDLRLRQRGIYTFPKKLTCISSSVSLSPAPDFTNEFIGTLPAGLTGIVLDQAEIFEYYVVNNQVWINDQPNFTPFNFGDQQSRIIRGESISIGQYDRNAFTGSSTNRFPVPYWFYPLGRYRTTS